MLHCRRLIAYFLIVLFLPAVALAGVPLQLCLGNDGHRVVEPLAIAHHHRGHISDQKGAVGRNLFAPGTHLKFLGDDCRDVLIGAEAVSSTRNNSELMHKIASDQPGKILTTRPAQPPFCRPFIQEADGTGSASVIVRDPRLVSLATVVLLN